MFGDIQFDINELFKEFEFFKKSPGKLCIRSSKNNIIKYFQQNTFYKIEKELLNDQNVLNWMISNRMKYLNKTVDELTILDLLDGFKRSGFYIGYSHFNPLLFKWFIKKYNCHTCYDPCGGWGHRLLGSFDLDLYIYNDLSTSTYNGVNNIIKCFNINNCITYNEDCIQFEPQECYDSMFTCPPYYNIEHYECGDFENIDEYYLLIESLFYSFYSKDSCKIFGLVIREDLLEDTYKNLCTEKIKLSNITSSHLSTGKEHKNIEYLYIFKK